jgi:phosphonate transport system substrate-binding protein
MNIFKQRERFRPLAGYLSKKLGIPVEFTVEERYRDLMSGFHTEKYDGAFFESFHAAMAIRKDGVVPVARTVNLDGSSTYRGRVFVRKDSGIHEVQDLRGKRMAFVDLATTSGYVFPIALLRQKGVADPDTFLGPQTFVGRHDTAIYAVLDGKADAGAAKSTVFDKIRAEDPRVARDLLVLADSAPMPSSTLCVRNDLPTELQAKLKGALLDLARDPEGAKVLYALGATRFVETAAAEFQPVLDLMKSADLDPMTFNYTQR